jgi:hypothetical protein
VQGFLGKVHFSFALFESQHTLNQLLLQAISLFQETLLRGFALSGPFYQSAVLK